MTAKSLDEKIEIVSGLAAPLAEALGLELWGVEIIESGRSLVRVYVDAPAESAPASGAPDPDAPDHGAQGLAGALERHGVDVEACAEISRHIALALEVEDVFPSAYVLEVSSPGFSRPFFRLEQLPPYLGQLVEVALKAPLDESGRKKFQGKLMAATDDSIILEASASGKNPEPVLLPWKAVHKARRVHIFEEKVKPGKKPSRRAADGDAAPERENP